MAPGTNDQSSSQNQGKKLSAEEMQSKNADLKKTVGELQQFLDKLKTDTRFDAEAGCLSCS
jgi:uncharacterized FlaG/YvyC family protein